MEGHVAAPVKVLPPLKN